MIKILLTIKMIKMILTIATITTTTATTKTTKTTIIIIIIIIIIGRIKCRGRHKSSTTTNTELLLTSYNGQKPLSNIKKSSISDAVRVQYMPLKWLIHQLM